ncbi:MAG: arginine repressor [Acutalibacteraceae bacterium]
MKRSRLEKIRSIISHNDVTTQEELLELLRADGCDVTQATVSRDIKELRLIKITDSNGVQKYASMAADSASPEFSDIFAKSVISITCAMNDIVIKCYTGMANAACAALDNMNHTEVVGTLAGDDTIFVITQNESAARTLAEKLNKIIG